MDKTTMNESLNQILEKLESNYKHYKNAKVKIAITGQSGNGKSSIINALFEKKMAEVGSTETTMEIKSYIHNGTELFDLPGCGTPNFPKDNYVDKCELRTYDAAIIVTANRFLENDLWLIEEMSRLGKPVYVVRSKMDEAVRNEKRDNNLTEQDVFQKVLLDLEVNLKSVPVKGIYLISSVERNKWDFNKLFEDIANNLSDMQKKRFYSDVAILNETALQKKREIAIDIINYRAIVAAINGVNPIPGVDVAVDVAILLNLSKEIQDIYGLNEEHAKSLEKRIGDSIVITKIKNNIASFASKFLIKEGILILLKRFGTSLAAKEVIKYIPFLGQAIAAGIGYKLTRSFGEELLDDAENIARQVLEAGTSSILNHN